jgi:hypothetical protein
MFENQPINFPNPPLVVYTSIPPHLCNKSLLVKCGVGGQIAADDFVPLSTESYWGMGSQARKILQLLAMALVSSAVAGLDVTMSALRTGSLCSLGTGT